MTPKQKTYGLIFLISLTFSIVLYDFVVLKKIPQASVINQFMDSASGRARQNFFLDLDNDGIKEKLTLHNNNSDKFFFSLVINNYKKQSFLQYNLKATNMNYNWIDFTDINGDSTDEIIPFYNRNDTIFCSVIDYENDKFLEKDLVVLVKPDTIYADVWDPIFSITGNLHNSLDQLEIIFSINTGFSQKPRGVFAFNLSMKNITKKFLMGASLDYANLFDLTKDGNDEIIITTSSTTNNGHLPKMPYYNDYKSWLIVLDNNFDTLFTKCFNKQTSGISCSYLTNKASNYLISRFMHGNTFSIYKIDKQGKILNNYVFKNSVSGANRSHYWNIGDNINILGNNTINVFDTNLMLLDTYQFKNMCLKLYPLNLGKEQTAKYLLWERNRIDILDKNYAVISSIDKQLNLSKDAYVSYSMSGGKIDFSLISDKKTFEFTLLQNSLYSLRYLFFLGLFFVILPLVFLLNNLTNRTLIFISLLKVSTSRSNKGIIIVNPKKKYSFINSSAKNILTFNKTVLKKGMNLSELIKENKSLSNFIDSTFSLVKARVSDIYLSNGKIIRVKILPIKSPLGMLLAFYIQIDDLTKILQTDRSKIIAHSIQKVAHEIKTPLSSVLLSLDSLEQDWNNNTKKISITDDISVARKEIDRVKKFINNFLKFANMAGTQIDEFNLKEIIENSLVRFVTYQSKGIEIKLDVPDNINVLVDHFQMEEVFQVFIENGIDAMHGKGIIDIAAKQIDNNRINISIKDTGDGISEEEITSIFQPYMTTKKDGTGMGLAIAKKIIEEHGGKISVRSTFEIGTIFSFNLRNSVVANS